MTRLCVFPGCTKPVRPVPRARYCSWEHLTEATALYERARRKKRSAQRQDARQVPVRPPVAIPPQGQPLPPDAFHDDPRAVADRGSRGRLSAPAPHRFGASSLVMG